MSPRNADTRAATATPIGTDRDVPVIEFDRVQLAFDDVVVLREVSFTLLTGHTKIVLGASGAGKSIMLKLI
ncbi:MAG: ABC transporter ATP-binding protein, partial [Acidobacteria bacterium]|nr:ABC transporter ATP-binding protein [Acidobacteriota bacterium]